MIAHQQSASKLNHAEPPMLGRSTWVSIIGMGAFILGLNLVGWGLLIFKIVPDEYSLGASGVLGVGMVASRVRCKCGREQTPSRS